MTIKFREGEIQLFAGELFVVPKGVDHKPCEECKILVIEPRGVINTSENEREFTMKKDIDLKYNF